MEEQVWLSLLHKFGQQVTLVKGEERQECRAFFQPVRAAGPGEVPTVLGGAPQGKYLYLGPPQPDPQGIETLIWQERRYHFIRCRPMYVGQRVAYQWAVAEESDRGHGL